ncbi:hypothetical protein [Paraflavitalea pollutisoli]|uniref:hypothetical protein n=1 Tax=Paraflavitalea pollutisoli TaxID=3034143 RepID=UPI0023EACB4E|nr:hypothetical protein [Paraflavitalea sp. H1-2-19X]
MEIINGVHYYKRESDAKEGFAIRPAKGTTRPVLLCVHGIGERGAGQVDNLINLIDGFDYDGPGPLPRQYAFENTTIEVLAAKYDFHLVTVNYPDSFQPNDFTYVLGQVSADFSVDQTRLYIAGFSLGGGAILKKVTASVTDAASLAGAIAAAPVNWATTHKNVADARLQVIGTTCEIDDTVSPANVKDFVAKVNAYKPEFPAYLIVYSGHAHSGFNEILAEENTWQWMAANSTTKRIAFTRSSTLTPTKPVDPPPSTTVKADFNVKDTKTSGSAFELDASASVGASEYYWEVSRTTAPWYSHKLQGGAGGGPKKLLSGLVPGEYQVTLTVNGKVKTDTRKLIVEDGIAIEPETRRLTEATGSIVLKYSDGTTGTAKVSVVDGKLVVTE